MRVFMTLSCNSPVSVERRCNGVANAESSRVRLICKSWLRVNTISETRVIRPSRTSTETRMDWVVVMPCESSPPRPAIGSGADFAAATGAAAATGTVLISATGSGSSISVTASFIQSGASAAAKAASRSASDTSPGRRARPVEGSTSPGCRAFGASSGPSAEAKAASRSASETSPGRRARPVAGSISPTPKAGPLKTAGSISPFIGRSGTSTA